jgi:hypothetical protein
VSLSKLKYNTSTKLHIVERVLNTKMTYYKVTDDLNNYLNFVCIFMLYNINIVIL